MYYLFNKYLLFIYNVYNLLYMTIKTFKFTENDLTRFNFIKNKIILDTGVCSDIGVIRYLMYKETLQDKLEMVLPDTVKKNKIGLNKEQQKVYQMFVNNPDKLCPVHGGRFMTISQCNCLHDGTLVEEIKLRGEFMQ